jgi:hypothetical protein
MKGTSMRLVRISEKVWVNPEQVAYICEGNPDDPWASDGTVWVVTTDGRSHVAQGSLLQVAEGMAE